MPAWARLTLAPAGGSGLPPRVRVNLADADAPAGLARGAVVSLRARLMPPPEAALPGAVAAVLHNITGAVYAWLVRRTPTEKELAAQSAERTDHDVEVTVS